jgi:hypothetical protein
MTSIDTFGTNPIDRLLDRLQEVRARGSHRWLAKCPAHDDRSPSLSICELDDGRILVHDFAGCSASDVVAAVGLELKDLFPPRYAVEHRSRPVHRAFEARDVLACLVTEGQVLAVAAENWRCRMEFTCSDIERISLAAGRIHAAWRLCNGNR